MRVITFFPIYENHERGGRFRGSFQRANRFFPTALHGSMMIAILLDFLEVTRIATLIG